MMFHNHKQTPTTAPTNGKAHMESFMFALSQSVFGMGMTEYVEKAIMIELITVIFSLDHIGQAADYLSHVIRPLCQLIINPGKQF